MHDRTPALRRELADLAGRLGADELRLLCFLGARLWLGQSRYGCLRLARDRRDVRGEALEEFGDAALYLAMATMSRPRRRSRRRRKRVAFRA